MNALVIYESLTGNTARAARLIGDGLSEAGITTVTCPVTAVDYEALSRADLVVIGTWTDGIVVAGQRPGRAARLRGLPAMGGKRAAVFATYAIAPGKVLDKLVAIVEDRGAEVLGGMTIRRDRLERSAGEFVDRLLAVVAPA